MEHLEIFTLENLEMFQISSFLPSNVEIFKILKFDVTEPSRIYNADQTGLFYRQLPSRIYVKKGTERNIRGNKTHKDKERLTLMVACAADGTKVPLCVVGKP